MKKKYCFLGGKALAEWIKEYDKDHSSAKIRYNGTGSHEYYYPGEDSISWNRDDRILEGYEVITFEEWRDYIYQGKQIPGKEVVVNNYPIY